MKLASRWDDGNHWAKDEETNGVCARIGATDVHASCSGGSVHETNTYCSAPTMIEQFEIV